jgi:hypothetical protein
MNYTYEQLQPTGLQNHSEACIIRVKAYANGALFALSHTDNANHAVDQQIIDLTEKYIELFNKVKQVEHSKLKFYSLMQELQKYIHELSVLTNLSSSELEMAESIWVWQNYEWNTLQTPVDINDSIRIEQIDKAMKYPLTQTQQQEWARILDDNKPAWFTCFPEWLKNFLTKLVENKDWQALNRFIPTALRSIPGLANTTQHELQVYKNGELAHHTTCYRYGVPVPYDVESDSERGQMTDENIEQFLNYWLLDDKLKNQFMQYWGIQGDVLPQQVTVPFLMINLLTSLHQGNYKSWLIDGLRLSGSQNNTLMTDFIHASVAKWSEKHRGQHADFSAFDFAVNSCRSKSPVVLSLYFLNQLEDTVAALKSIDNLDEARQKRLNCLEQLLTHLEQHRELDVVKGRNKNLFSAALLDLSTRLLGGLSAGNCKSSKDRKGLELLTADAMLIYFEVYGEFPSYNDTGEKRANFLKICEQLYVAGHHMMIAHHNAPGSLGLKDEGIMDSDLKHYLGESYCISKQNADLNNPYTFIEKYWSTIRNITIAIAVTSAVVASALVLGNVIAPLAVSFVLFSSLQLTSMFVIFALSLGSAAALLGAVQCYNDWKKGPSVSELLDAQDSKVMEDDDSEKENKKQSCFL